MCGLISGLCMAGKVNMFFVNSSQGVKKVVFDYPGSRI